MARSAGLGRRRLHRRDPYVAVIQDGALSPPQLNRGLSQRQKSMKAPFERNTDTAIFNLGTAFKTFSFDVDDFFHSSPCSAGRSFSEPHGGNTFTTTTTSSTKANPDGSTTTVTTSRERSPRPGIDVHISPPPASQAGSPHIDRKEPIPQGCSKDVDDEHAAQSRAGTQTPAVPGTPSPVTKAAQNSNHVPAGHDSRLGEKSPICDQSQSLPSPERTADERPPNIFPEASKRPAIVNSEPHPPGQSCREDKPDHRNQNISSGSMPPGHHEVSPVGKSHSAESLAEKHQDVAREKIAPTDVSGEKNLSASKNDEDPSEKTPRRLAPPKGHRTGDNLWGDVFAMIQSARRQSLIDDGNRGEAHSLVKPSGIDCDHTAQRQSRRDKDPPDPVIPLEAESPAEEFVVDDDSRISESSSDEPSSLCCAKISHRKRKRFAHNRQVQAQGRRAGAKRAGDGKGKTGMTASEVTGPGAEDVLPTLARMMMNFSRMLDVNQELYVETLFRAVKLNGVDVVGILCRLAIRKNIKLSSEGMREPESSATVLHVALLYNHEHIINFLLGLKDRDLSMATYTNGEYKNQTALHVAVANCSVNVVRALLQALNKKDRKALMNTVASGSYFRKKHPDGQLCLTAACWAGNTSMLVALASLGANFALANLNGDTLMHRLIVSSAELPDKMDYQELIDRVLEALCEWTKHLKYKSSIGAQVKLEQKQRQVSMFFKMLHVQNNNGETPMVLAAKLGSSLLVYLMNLEKIFKIPQTKLGSISWVTYDVTEITTFALDAYNKLSVLHVLAHNNGKLSRRAALEGDDVSLLDTEPIKSLIEMKWSVYRCVYICWFFGHLLYMVAFTYWTFDVNSAHIPLDPYAPTVAAQHSSPVQFRLAMFVLVPALYIVLEFVDWFGNLPYTICLMRHQSVMSKMIHRIQSEWVITGNGPYRSVCLGYAVCSIVWFVLYALRSSSQEILLALALLFGWIFVLFFTRGCRVTSRFSIMIQKMFFRDLMYFLAVYIVIMLSFSFSIIALYAGEHQASRRLPFVMHQMMNILTDLEERESIAQSRHPRVTYALLVVYAVVSVILLMNMLIAMMNTSYETVRITSCNLWKLQQLSVMLMIERRLAWCKPLCRRSERDVWIKQWEQDDVRAYLDVTVTTKTSTYAEKIT